MATGLPIVATRHSAFPDQVFPGKNGYLSDEADPAGLAESILLLLNQPQDWPAMGHFGRSLAKEKYDAGNLIERQIGYYEEVIGR